jgi:hypothetical protein
MEMRGWRWMLLVLLLGGEPAGASGIATPLFSPHGVPIRPPQIGLQDDQLLGVTGAE